MLDSVKENQTSVSRETFANRFAELFNFASAAEIGRKIDIPHATVSNYLKGRMPAPDVLVKIANQTSVSLNWLLIGEGSKFLTKEINQSGAVSEPFTQPYAIFNEEALALFIRRIAREELEDAIREEYFIDAASQQANVRDIQSAQKELVDDLGSVGGEAQERVAKKRKA